MCRTRCHVEKCCFLVSDEGEKFGAGEAGIVHISLAVRLSNTSPHKIHHILNNNQSQKYNTNRDFGQYLNSLQLQL